MTEKEASGSQNKMSLNEQKRADYFMATAFLAAKRNEDPTTRNGACIVNEDGKIVGVGHNELRFSNEFHAEMNAILNKNSSDVKNCKMYVRLFPCNVCAKIIIQSGIREVIYMSANTQTTASKKLFDAAKVECRQFEPQSKTIEIDFMEIETEREGVIRSENSEQVSGPQEKKQKLADYLDAENYFMAMAFLAAKQSKDPNTQVGACIVNDERKIVGVGYNGFPKGAEDKFSWEKKAKRPFVCHAEMNAILNKNSSDVKNCTMYVALFPCNECAKIIIQSGIRKVIYKSDKRALKCRTLDSKKMLDAAKVTYSPFVPKRSTIEINFFGN